MVALNNVICFTFNFANKMINDCTKPKSSFACIRG